MNPELKAHITMRKKNHKINELAKEAVQNAGNENAHVIVHILNSVMANGFEFGSLFQRAAELYTAMDIHVDARMESGKKMLQAVSKEDFLHGSKEIQIPLIALSEREAEQLESLTSIADAFNHLTEMSKDVELFEMCANALCQAMIRQHPTLTQSFLSSFRGAALANDTDERYLFLGNAYSKAMPLI